MWASKNNFKALQLAYFFNLDKRYVLVDIRLVRELRWVCQLRSESKVRPRTLCSLTCRMGCEPIDNVNKRGSRWCFCLVVITIDLVLSGWIDMQFFKHQLFTSSSPSWRHELSSSIFFDAVWIDASSANKVLVRPFLIWSGRSLMYKRNSSGPRTDPCGTPDLIMPFREVVLFTLTNWCRFSRNDLMKLTDGRTG